MKKELSSYILIHIAVVLFGFTAILGSIIEVHPLSIVWWRVLIASISLSFLVGGFRFLRVMPKNLVLKLCLIGGIIAIHWVTFFASIKLAGASFCLICMATTCLFLTIIEPLVSNKSFDRLDFGIAIFIVPGMFFVVQGLNHTNLWGVLLGLISACLAALYSILNKRYVHVVQVWQLSWIEMVSAFLTLSVIMGIYRWYYGIFKWWPNQNDWIYLLILGVICTTIAHAMSLIALRHLSAFALNLVVNLEPVYGIFLAAVMLGEHKRLTLTFYIGASLILLAVLFYPSLKKKIAHVVY